MAFAKLKALLRSAAARTIPDLWDAIRRSQAFSHQLSVETTSPLHDTTQPDRMPLWEV